MALKQAFNAILRLHSRSATLKRNGDPNIYSPCRITPSNYFRFLEGPASTVIRGREFIIPIDTMVGHFTELLTFVAEPTEGTYILDYNEDQTIELAFDADAEDIQAALRDLDGLEAVIVTGNYADGFRIVFVGFEAQPELIVVVESMTPIDTTGTSVKSTPEKWSPILKRGDRIVDLTYGNMAIDEIIEVVDLGGAIMGYRCRVE